MESDKRRKLLDQITAYVPFNEQEERDRELILHALKTEKDVFTRDNALCHMTASAWIVNAERHEREVQKGHIQRLPQKVPPRYQISLHIDDEESIIKNARTYGFHALRVYEPDDEWVTKVLNEAERIRKLEELTKEGASNE